MNILEQLLHFIIETCCSIRIVWLKELHPLVDKVQCTTKVHKGLCWWSTWKIPVTTTACINRFYWTVLLILCINSTHKIISVLYSPVEENFKWISMQLQEYCRIIPWTATNPLRTQLLNIKLEVHVVLKNICNLNTQKQNVNNKMSDNFVERFVFYIPTNLFLEFFSHDTNWIRFIIMVTPNNSQKH